MGGGELIIKNGDFVWLLKLAHHGQALEEFLIMQKQAFNGTPEEVLKKFLSYFDASYYNGQLDLNTFFPRGFKSQINFDNITSSSNIAEVMYHVECRLHEKIVELNLNPDEEDFLEVFGEHCSLLVDFDQGKIFGYLDDEGDFVIVDKNFQVSKEQF